ncbi:GDSL-type esterase/lipase family protein [Reichenbachiella carrageenanivorans]|uniref:GDSL-type esterase/lipase family protein n=1 Tax=Reichenbachiella carrageenanivorans TaxID=2979869 RepID=A0ABY6D4C4_9BACT|nr:GDSL-type esterase/lipase family protein [Reichenbachiella carrageenanivorans]UXX79903.1 GDSL-type esterase/lipase family protein [Reichenbachiella carrageenanivorans]
MNNYQLVFGLFLALAMASCEQSYQRLPIAPLDEAVSYQSRIDIDQPTSVLVDLYWSGAAVRVSYEGDSLFATLQDERGDNYFNVIIDQDSVRLLSVDTTKTKYLLAAGLSSGSHTVELFKRTEWIRGKTTFFGFEVTGIAPKISKPAAKRRKMEFYGNSITAGYAVDDGSGADSPDSVYTNHYVSYASLVARHFDASYHSICRSGIGVMLSWFPMIMPEMYDRVVPTDSTRRWDFATYTPAVVVINLFQNDSWLIEKQEHPEFKARFGEEKPRETQIVAAYQEFVLKIRAEYPEAHIVCLLGNMNVTQAGSPWPGYVAQAVALLGDDRIYAHAVPFKETPGHPNRAEQELLAESLITFINNHIEW